MADTDRCAICGWPLAASPAGGCVRGNCSMRPLPTRYFDAKRAALEYGNSLVTQAFTPESLTKYASGLQLEDED